MVEEHALDVRERKSDPLGNRQRCDALLGDLDIEARGLAALSLEGVKLRKAADVSSTCRHHVWRPFHRIMRSSREHGSRGNGYGMSMTEDVKVTVRMFGLLHSARKAAGLPTTVEIDVPEEGATARQIANDLGLAVDVIEGVFVNRTVYDLGHPVMPGDRIAFVPQGTPGPHRFYLGLYRAGRVSESDD